MIANRLRPLLIVAALASVTVPRLAFAGDAAAAAEVLFGEGKRLAQEGNFAAACPKLEESQKLDPGMGTLYRLADCYEHVGRTASAWAAFVEVASSAKAAGQQARADDAKKRADALAPTLAKLVIRVADPDLAGLVVKRGDVVVGKAQWSTPIPVDPGEIAIEASAPGRKTWRGTANVPARGSGQVDVPKLETAPAEGAAPPADYASPQTTSSLVTQRTVALALGVAGVVGLGVGTAFGLSSMSKKGDADAHCDASNACDTEGLSLRKDAIGAGDLSTIGFVAGGVLAGAAAVLWFTAPSSSTRTGRLGVAPRWGGASFLMELP